MTGRVELVQKRGGCWNGLRVKGKLRSGMSQRQGRVLGREGCVELEKRDDGFGLGYLSWGGRSLEI